jgi:type IV pilus assembly protein PilW
MNTFPSHQDVTGGRAQRGFTLVELMIAILIGLFLVGGLLTLTSAMKRTSGVQGDLAQLHDTERLSLSLMTEVIQSAGYFAFPSPPGTTTIASTFPAGTFGGTTWVAAQTISGTDTGTGSTQTDTVSVRYTSLGGDGILNCLGATVTAPTNWVAKFLVDGAGNLQCALTTGTTATAGVGVILANGVQYMQVLYGVQTSTAAGTYSVDTYLTATQVTAGNYWPNVISAQVTLWFVNPLYCTTSCQAGQQTTQPATISMSRTIALMSKAGVNTL